MSRKQSSQRRRTWARACTTLAVACSVWMVCAPARAWIYPEHRQISVEAWRKLSGPAADFYLGAWQRARSDLAGMCEAPSAQKRALLEPNGTPCIDFADWPALAGDHSCSPEELLSTTLPSRWAHDVARVSEEVQRDLLEADDQDERENVWIASNLRLQTVDDGYVTRAGGNNAHFLLSRVGESLPEFIAASTQRGAPLNALGLYVQYHAAALRLAAAVGPDPSRAPARLLQRVLALEAYALHFLQDMYASGHVAGTWGDAATRKGTHDYYCSHGYATSDWSGRDLILFGDSQLRPADLERSANAIVQSLLQVFEAARTPRTRGPDWTTLDAAALAVTTLDSCNRPSHPATITLDASETQAIEQLLVRTPKPGYSEDSVGWPRHRADFGTFLGVESGISIGGAFGSYGANTGRAFTELGIGLRIGYGLEGVVASLNTGTMFLHLGIVRESEQLDFCAQDSCRHQLGSESLPRVPSRAGIALALRVPFWLIPGDLIVLAPILALVSPATLTRVAMRAASGGLIPWQRTFHTPIGQMELVLGRVVGVTLYGMAQRVRSYLPVEPGSTSYFEVGSRAVALTFPVLEYTPLRAVSQVLTASLQIQLAYAIDIPFDTVRYGNPMRPGPDWGPAHLFLLKVNLNGRGYL